MYNSDVRAAALDLLGAGATLSEVSRSTGVARSTLRTWVERPPPAPAGECWRCVPGVDVPARPYTALLGFYLGDGCLSLMGRVHALRVSCDAAYPGITDAVSDAVRGVRPGARVQRVKAPGTVVVQSYWKHWPCLFPQHGPGRKHERALGMAAWQWALVEQWPADFLRGLFHSDGCRVRNWARRPVGGQPKRYDYPRWQFTNVSAEIRGWCCEALDLVGVPWRQSNAKTISVSTRAGVARLDELLGLKA